MWLYLVMGPLGLPYKKGNKTACFSLCSPPCDGTMRRWPSVNQEGGLYQEPNHAGILILDLQTSEL